MNQNEETQETIDVLTLFRQMEGVENNARVSTSLLNIYNTIVMGNPSDKELQFDLMMGTLLEINRDTFAKYEEHQQLPEEERNFFLSGALSAQETFYNTLTAAYNDAFVVHVDERIAMVRDVIEEQIEAALEAVAEPLAALRASAREDV